MEQSTIRAFQGVLTKFQFPEAVNFPEDFAIKRYLKKMEAPDSSKVDLLSEQCFEKWLINDESLPNVVLPMSHWYKARDLIFKWVSSYLPKSASIDFPKGSEFVPTLGQNSIEARLVASKWTCTHDNFPAFARLCYEHKALRRAVRRRFDRWFRRSDFDLDLRRANMMLYNHFCDCTDIGFQIFSWKLERVTLFVHGSRFSTVPKNNEKRRPINIEPFGNILVQRRIGNKIRTLLKGVGLDLDETAEIHREAISKEVATIDLSDASDSISTSLVQFLLPTRLFEEIMASRSQMTLGLDGSYHIPRKISSMGNGFTFELMTMILFALGRTFDPRASVFGDDIIISREAAEPMIECMTSVGLKVNKSKTFIYSKFRESCGSNYHDDFGYIKSFDFLYPENIHDCIVIYNKAKALSVEYNAFSQLEQVLLGFIPRAWRGGPFCNEGIQTNWSIEGDDELSGYFMTDCKSNPRDLKMRKIEATIAERYQYHERDVHSFVGFKLIPSLRSQTVKHLSARRHWGKYEMYLFSGRRAKDVLSGCGQWGKVRFVSINSRASRLSRLTE
jgi:hypothetical protein